MTDITALGEILIDFTSQGKNGQGQNSFIQNPGGAPANVAAAISRLGGKSAFIGKAGDDMHGRFLKSTLENCGIDVTGLTLDSDYFTTLAFVDIKKDGEREFSFARNHGADKMLSVKDVPIELIKNSKIFHFGSVSLTDDPSRSATLFAADEARKAGVAVAYDPNYRASLWRSEADAVKEMRSAAYYADLIKISDEETNLLTGESDCEKAAKILTENGAKIAAITLGKDGAYIHINGSGKYIPAFKANAIDATGAGDAFWGGFLWKLSQCDKPLGEITIDEAAEIALFANAVASLCVERIGAIPAMPYLDEVEQRLNKK